MWFYGFFLKLLPCVVLTVLTASLIHAMYQVRSMDMVQVIITILCRQKISH